MKRPNQNFWQAASIIGVLLVFAVISLAYGHCILVTPVR